MSVCSLSFSPSLSQTYNPCSFCFLFRHVTFLCALSLSLYSLWTFILVLFLSVLFLHPCWCLSASLTYHFMSASTLAVARSGVSRGATWFHLHPQPLEVANLKPTSSKRPDHQLKLLGKNCHPVPSRCLEATDERSQNFEFRLIESVLISIREANGTSGSKPTPAAAHREGRFASTETPPQERKP